MANKGAVEISIGTVVIIVLAMSMLIFGLVLAQRIFSSEKTTEEKWFNENCECTLGCYKNVCMDNENIEDAISIRLINQDDLECQEYQCGDYKVEMIK